MSLFSSYCATYGILLIILLLVFKYCRDKLKIYVGYPVLHAIPYILYCEVFGKIPKDMPLHSFALKLVTEKCMQHMKEGLCLTYIPQAVLLVFGEETVKIFSKDKSAADKPVLYSILQDMIGPGLITQNGEKWKKHRKMLNPAFSLGMLKEKVPLFNDHALAFVKDLETLVGKPSVNLLDLIKCHYFNALSEYLPENTVKAGVLNRIPDAAANERGRTCRHVTRITYNPMTTIYDKMKNAIRFEIESIFGLKQTEENRAENLKYFHGLDSLCASTIYRVGKPWLQWKFMLSTTSHGREILRVHEESSNFIKNVILKLKQHITSNETSDPECFSKNLRKSLTYILLQHHLNDPSFTFEDLHAHVGTFMFGGYDTVSHTTMWCLFMLGLHPEVQEKAYNEVQSDSKKNYISYEDSSNFTYLKSVIMETLRLYPTIPLFERQLSQDVQCGERIIPKDTIIAFFIYVMHRNPDIYPDPEIFDPERFLGSNKINPWTFMPFSEGYRNCIGKTYALIVMKIFLAHFLRNFKITSLDKREDIGVSWTVVLSPAKPLRMLIERR